MTLYGTGIMKRRSPRALQVKTAQSVCQLTAPLLDMEEALRPIALSASWDSSKHSKAPKAGAKASLPEGRAEGTDAAALETAAVNAPKPAAIDAPEPAAVDAPKPAAVDAPKPAAVDAPKLAAVDAPNPAAGDAPKPAAASAEKARPPASSALRPPARWVDPDLLQRGSAVLSPTILLPAISASVFGINLPATLESIAPVPDHLSKISKRSDVIVAVYDTHAKGLRGLP